MTHNAWRRFGKLLTTAGPMLPEARMPRRKTFSCRWNRSSGSSVAGEQVYRLHLDDRNVETYARRRFGLHTRVPQIAKRFGFRYALHMGFDAGKFPIPAETKRLWESPDGSSLESLMRPPIAADRPAQGWLLPWRIAATMRNDHVGAIPLVHWPEPVAPWYVDLRRAGSYSPVLGRWTTLNDFFHLTDRPYESLRPEPDLYQTPYLAQAVAKRERAPIGRLARHHKLRRDYDAISVDPGPCPRNYAFICRRSDRFRHDHGRTFVRGGREPDRDGSS